MTDFLEQKLKELEFREQQLKQQKLTRLRQLWKDYRAGKIKLTNY